MQLNFDYLLKGIKLTYQQNVILECLNNYGKNEFGLYAKILSHVLPEVLNSIRRHPRSEKSVKNICVVRLFCVFLQ